MTKTQQIGRVRRFLLWYERHHKKRPLLVKMLTGSFCAGLGDFICQQIIEKSKKHSCDILCIEYNPEKKQFDVNRLLRLSLYSFCISGPMMHISYQHFLPYMAPGNSYLAVFKKVLFQQTMFNVCGQVIFFGLLTLAEGNTIE